MVTIIYCRYSSDMQRPESCADQERKVREYLLRNNIPSGEIVVHKDEAVSGTKEAREAYDQIAQMIGRREPFLLAVDDQSRLSRGDNAKALIRDLVFAGGRFISTGENIDTAQSGWEPKVGIMELHNSLTIADLGRRVRRGQEGRILDANGSAGDFPYGYSSYYLDPHWQEAQRRGPKPKKGVCIYEEEARQVRQVFEWFIGGRSISWITRELNRLRVDKGYRASRPGWHHYQVRRMLSNPKYIGRWSWGKTRTMRDSHGKKRQVAVAHEEIVAVERPGLRIIDPQVWSKAQELLGKLMEIFGLKPQQKPRGSKAHYTQAYPKGPMGGLLFCGSCGARLVAQGGYKDVYYGCPNYRKGDGCEQLIRVPRQKALEVLIGFLRDAYQRHAERMPEVTRALEARLKELSARLPTDIESKLSEREKLGREIRNLTTAIAESGSSGGTLVAALAQRETRLALLVQELNDAGKLASIQVTMPAPLWIEEQIKHLDNLLSDDPVQMALVLRRLLGKVIAHAMPLASKRRGYVRLQFTFSVWSAGMELLKDTIPGALVLKEDMPGVVMNRVVCLDIGGPTRMDEWAPKIAEMRAQGVKWERIGEISGLGTGNAHNAWKRWTDVQKPEAAKETA
jgi:DNA invertase Pin-like site-specific DNA recombinase